MNKFLVVLVIALQSAHGAQGASEWADSSSSPSKSAPISRDAFELAVSRIESIRNRTSGGIGSLTGQILELRKELNIYLKNPGLAISTFTTEGGGRLTIDQHGVYNIVKADRSVGHIAGAESAFAAATSETATRPTGRGGAASIASSKPPVIITQGLGVEGVLAMAGLGADRSSAAAGAAAPAMPWLESLLSRASSVQAVGSSGVRDVVVPAAPPMVFVEGAPLAQEEYIDHYRTGSAFARDIVIESPRIELRDKGQEAGSYAFKFYVPSFRAKTWDGFCREFIHPEHALVEFVSNDPEVKTHEQGIVALVHKSNLDPSSMVSILDGTPIAGASAGITNAAQRKFEVLSRAIGEGSSQDVKRMIDAGHDVNAKSPNGKETPLKLAMLAFQSNPDAALSILNVLVDKGADVATPTNDVTPLMLLLSFHMIGNIDEQKAVQVANMFLTKGAKATMNHVHPTTGLTALGHAVNCTSLPLVNLLLKNGANPAVFGEGKNPLKLAVGLGVGSIVNALLHTIMTSDLDLPIDPSRVIETNTGKKNTLLHIASLGGEHWQSNMKRILHTKQGIEALSVKDSEGNLPEDIAHDDHLKAQMQELRQNYLLFQTNVKKDISKDLGLLSALYDIATHILECNPGNMDADFLAKAQSIRDALPVLRKEIAVNEKILPLEEALDNLRGILGSLKVVPSSDAKNKKRLTGQIEAICKQLTEGYPAAKALATEVPHVIVDLESKMKVLRDDLAYGSMVSRTMCALIPFTPAEEAARMAARELAEVSARASSAAAAAAGSREPAFDMKRVGLNLETLEAFISCKSQKKAIKGLLDQKIAAAKKAAVQRRGATTINERPLSIFILKVRHILEFSAGVPSQYAGLTTALQTLFDHQISDMFIWEVLKFSDDAILKDAYKFIEALKIDVRDPFEAGSVHGSLITPGGKAPRGGGVGGDDRTVGGGTWDGGSTVFGTVAAAGRLAEVREVRADGKVVDEEPVAAAGPRFVFTDAITRGDVDTLLRLFQHDWTNIGKNGQQIIDLFNRLGNGFSAERTRESKIKIVKGESALESADSGDDEVAGSGAAVGGKSVGTHRTHGTTRKGLNPAFGASCVKLLKSVGIEQQDVRQLQIRSAATASSAGGGAAAAAASRSSDYVEGEEYAGAGRR